MRIIAQCLVGVLIAGLTGVASADPLKCQRSILKESVKLTRSRAKELQKCEDRKLTGKLPALTDCTTEPATAAKIAKAESKLQSRLDKACGGADRTCGTGDDEPLAAIGWPATCPDFQDMGCTNAITGCDDIATCLVCVSAEAVSQTVGLAYDDLTPAAEGTLLKCQRTIGGEVRRLVDAQASAVSKCWDARLKGGHSNPCPDPGDGKAAAKITKATSKARSKICRACGGADRTCGGPDDLFVSAVGFPTFCPNIGACATVVDSVEDLVDCVTCITTFDQECVDALPVPAVAVYPTQCAELAPPFPTALQLDGRPGVDIDLGFSGLVHDLPDPWLTRLTGTIQGCEGTGIPAFGTCTVSGPIPNAGGPAFANRRCSDQPWIACSTDPECAASGADGPCVFFLGPPQPIQTTPFLSFVDTVSCVLNEVAGPVTGTVNAETGAMELALPVTMRPHSRSWSEAEAPPGGPRLILPPPEWPPSVVTQPCPTCDAGVCVNGPRDGMPCVAQGQSAIYGDDMSLDCPPDTGFEQVSQTVTLPLSTGVTTFAVGAGSPSCTAAGFGAVECPCDTCNNQDFDPCHTDADCPDNPPGTPGICGGRRCLGGTNSGAPCTIPGISDPACAGVPCGTIGEPTKPDACLPGGCTPTGPTDGECANGPFLFRCAPTQHLLPCGADSDCTVPGDFCGTVPYDCFPGGSVAAVGVTDPPVNGVSSPTLASLQCLPPLSAATLNAILGLPGLGRVHAPVTATIR